MDGARVADILKKAGVKAGARHLHTFGSDKPPGKVPPFERRVEIDKAMEDGMVAYEMNGEPLPPPHGAPAPSDRARLGGRPLDEVAGAAVAAAIAAERASTWTTAYRFPNEPGAPGVAFKPDEMQPVTELFVKSNIEPNAVPS